jgi:hypothetical protein
VDFFLHRESMKKHCASQSTNAAVCQWGHPLLDVSSELARHCNPASVQGSRVVMCLRRAVQSDRRNLKAFEVRYKQLTCWGSVLRLWGNLEHQVPYLRREIWQLAEACKEDPASTKRQNVPIGDFYSDKAQPRCHGWVHGVHYHAERTSQR